MFPVRCFTCNKVIGKYETAYHNQLALGLKKNEALNTIGISKYCCRRMFLCHVNIIDKLLQFSQPNDNNNDKK